MRAVSGDGRWSLLRYGAALLVSFTSASVVGAFAASAGEPSFVMPRPAELPLSWSGVFVGVQAGYNGVADRLVETVTATGVPTGSVYRYDPQGFAGGLRAGVNYQVQSFVFGVLTDFEGTTSRGDFLDPSGVGKGHDTLPWQGSVRGRVGYSFGRFLAYATGGLAYADVRNTYVYVPTNTGETFERVVPGWTVGGGLDVAVDEHWIGTVEYRHSAYDTFANNAKLSFPGLTGIQHLRSDDVRLGLNYKF